MEASLSADERARGDALGAALPRRRFIADHGWRRRLLGSLTGRAPGDIEYRLDERGKPSLRGSSLRFNAARSAGTGLYVTCETAQVGVDVEEIRTDVDLAAMARRFFSAAERAALEQTPPSRRATAAFACWTRKEAWLKAAGTGLVFPLDEVDVWAGDDRPVRHGQFEVATVDAGPGMAGAVAIGGGDPPPPCGTLTAPAGEVLWLHKSLPSF